MTIIQDLGEYKHNHLYIKREDLIPFSFGGNKARKAELFFQVIEKGNFDSVVTYGSRSSNHCRVIANACYQKGLKCYIICPLEASEPSYNSKMIDMFDAETTVVSVEYVHDTIEKKISELKRTGLKPYFIEGGGHGNIGTEAYVRCYDEIIKWEEESGVHFDCVFVASGTGTTQAGLVCGQLLNKDKRNVIGISIARKNPRGRDIVVQSVRDYMNGRASEKQIQSSVIFLDDYTSGYALDINGVNDTVIWFMKEYGIPLDTTYTGKAFMGMSEYLSQQRVTNKNVLFIHTGGTPLFFDALNRI